MRSVLLLWISTCLTHVIYGEFCSNHNQKILFGPQKPKTRESVEVFYVNMEEQRVEISMDVKINAIPRSSWENVFLMGSNWDRKPGIWLHPHSASTMGFHVSFYDGRQNPVFDTGNALKAGETYNIYIKYDSSGVTVKANGETKSYPGNVGFGGYPSHLFKSNRVPVYLGDKHYQGADVEISNLIIQTGSCVGHR